MDKLAAEPDFQWLCHTLRDKTTGPPLLAMLRAIGGGKLSFSEVQSKISPKVSPIEVKADLVFWLNELVERGMLSYEFQQDLEVPAHAEAMVSVTPGAAAVLLRLTRRDIDVLRKVVPVGAAAA